MRLGFEDQHVTVRQHARLRELLPDRIELVAAGGLVEAERARQGARGGRRDPRRRGAHRRGLRVGAGARPGRPHRARGGAGARAGDAAAGRDRPGFPSIVAAGAHGALPHAEPRDVEIPRRRAHHPRHRLAARRLLLGLHAHVGDRRARRRPAPRSTTSSCAPSRRRSTPCGRARRARGRRRRARPDRRRRPRRPLRPRARPRRRARGPRGAAARAHRGRTRSRRATSSPSSRASTCPAAAACGSRTSSLITENGRDVAERDAQGADRRPAERSRPGGFAPISGEV